MSPNLSRHIVIDKNHSRRLLKRQSLNEIPSAVEILPLFSYASELKALKTIFKRPASAKILSENPAKDVKRLAENEKSFYVLIRDEEKVYLFACPRRSKA